MEILALSFGGLVFGVVLVLVLWASSPSFARIAGTVVIAGLAVATVLATVQLGRDVLAADRLVWDGRSHECGEHASWESEMTRESVAGPRGALLRIDVANARAAGLSFPRAVTEVPADYESWEVPLVDLGTDAIGNYTVWPSEALAGGSEPVEVVLEEELVVVRGPIESDTRLRASDVIGHLRTSLEWFYVVDDAVAIYRSDDGGTLELRNADLTLRARTTATGPLHAPILMATGDGEGGIYALSDVLPGALRHPDAPISILHLARDGRATRSEVRARLLAVSGLSRAQGGGLCLWSGGLLRGAVHLAGDPLAPTPWPLGSVLGDRLPLLSALALGWLGLVIAARRMRAPWRRWWAVRQRRVRVGEVHGEKSQPRWIEGNDESALRVGTWIGFDAKWDPPFPAVAIGIVVPESAPTYRASAKRALEAECVVHGTPEEVENQMYARLGAVLSPIALVLLFTSVPAVVLVLVLASR